MFIRCFVPMFSLFAIASCATTKVSTPEVVELGGTWKLVQNDFKQVDSSGGITDVDSTGERYLTLIQAGNKISGSSVKEASGHYCNDGLVDGKISGDELKLTLTFKESCCPGGKVKFNGTVDTNSLPYTFKRFRSPVAAIPPKDCKLFWGDFSGVKES